MLAVPDQFADVDALAQHAIAGFGLAADGKGVPAPARRSGYPCLVEAAGDGHGAGAGGIEGKDPPHDLGLLGDDFAQAPLDLPIGAQHTGDAAIAIGGGRDAAPRPYPSLDPLTGLGG